MDAIRRRQAKRGRSLIQKSRGSRPQLALPASQFRSLLRLQNLSSTNVSMASFVSGSDSDSDYSYDLTLEEEQELFALIDRIPQTTFGPSSSSTAAPAPVTAPTLAVRPRRAPSSVSVFSSKSVASSLDSYIKEAIAVHETIEGIGDNDLDFDIAELKSVKSEEASSHGSGSGVGSAPNCHTPSFIGRRYAPSVASDNRRLSSYVSQTKPRSTLSLLADSHVCYPDCKPFATHSPHVYL